MVVRSFEEDLHSGIESGIAENVLNVVILLFDGARGERLLTNMKGSRLLVQVRIVTSSFPESLAYTATY